MEWVSVNESVGSEQEFYWLWILATATYGVGDIVTTIALVYFAPGVQEGNPVVRIAIESLGLGGLVAVKLGAFFACLGISVVAMHYWHDRGMYVFPPVVLAIFGTVMTILNIRLIA